MHTRPRRRLAGALATVAVVTITAFSVVFGASTAQALHNGTFSQQELKIVQGGVKAAAPRVAARAAVAGAVCGGTLGIGCVALAVLGVGLLAYDTREIWLPWVKGNIGNDTEGQTESSIGTGWFVTTTQAMKDWRSTNNAGLTVAVSFATTASGSHLIEAECLNPDGSITLDTQRTSKLASASYSPPQHSGVMCDSGSGGINSVGRMLLKVTYLHSPVTNGSGEHTPVAWWERGGDVTSVESELVCRRPDGSTYSVTVVTTNPVDQIKVGHCEPGDTPVRIKTKADTTTAQDVPQWDAPLAPWDSTSDAEYPLCAGAATACTYKIKVDGEFCAAGIEKCTHWSYIYTQSPNRVECFWGPYSIAVDHCYFMERAYDLAPGSKTVTGPNTDGNPNTYTDPAPVPSRSGQTQPSPSPTPSPDPSTSPSPSPSVTPSTPVTEVKDPLTIACTTTSMDAGGLQPETVQLANKLDALFNIETIGGYRDPSGDKYGEHSSGLALDLMTYSDSAKGQGIADYLQNNATALKVRWIIWEQHVWSAERASEGWRLMEDRGSPTQNHMDHVHVLIYDQTLSGIPDAATCGGDPSGAAAGGGCLAKAVSWNPIDWVYWPTRCVLEWAFVPPQAEMQEQFAGVEDAWADSSPAKWVAVSSAIPDALTVAPASCEGPSMDLGGAFGGTVTPLNSCEGYAATAATAVRALSGAGLIVVTLLGCLRYVTAGLGYGGFRGGGEGA